LSLLQVDELKLGIVVSEPAALRVGDAMRLLPLVLLRHDPRVKRAYDQWLARTCRHEEAGDFTEPALLLASLEDSVQLNALVRDIGLTEYQTWLPRMLRWEFQRYLEGAAAVEVTVPDGLAWSGALAANRPKRQPGAMGGFRLENVEQHIERFYFCEVKRPRESKKALARRQGCLRSDVQHSVKRARMLLRCIDAPMPEGLSA